MQAAYRERQRCMEDNRAAHQLHVAANELIVLRDNREQIERELPTNASLRAQMPSGYADFVAATFARYRAAGGTAATIADVGPVADPCPPPALRSPVRAPESDGSSPVSQSRSIPRVPPPSR